MEPSREHLYKVNGRQYFNLFPGYMHQTPKPLTHKKEIDAIWNHVFEVLCSKNDLVFDYLKKWICNVVSGNKMRTCVYLMGGQGLGKSIIIEFIERCVLGKKIVFTTSDIGCVVGNFNGQLLGKVLLVLEEPPTESQSQWNSFSNALKHLITGETLEIKEKHKTNFTVTNHVSAIISSNHPVVKIENDDRRYLMADVSHHRVGDSKYFDELASYTTNKAVGEAFFWYCKEFVKNNPNFQEKVIPITEQKKDTIADNLHSVYTFIKDKYVLKNLGIDDKYSHVYDNYVKYCFENNVKKTTSRIVMSTLLARAGIKVTQGTGNVSFIKISKKDLLEIYKNKNWIHKTDDFNAYTEIDSDDELESIVDITENDFYDSDDDEIIETPVKKTKPIEDDDDVLELPDKNPLSLRNIMGDDFDEINKETQSGGALRLEDKPMSTASRMLAVMRKSKKVKTI